MSLHITRRPLRVVALFALAAMLAAIMPMHASAVELLPESRDITAVCGMATDAFADDNGNVHESAIDCLAHYGVSRGTGAGYEPAATVTRGQMASFIANAMTTAGYDFGDASPDEFPDDDGHAHETNINRLAAAKVVTGFANGTYRPGAVVTRDQMASFVSRAIQEVDEPLVVAADYFPDDNGNVHADNINALATQGIVAGDTQGRYNPRSAVRRDQMASFLARTAAYLDEQGRWPTDREPTPAGERVDLRVLVIRQASAEPSYEAWAAALEGAGVPFDTVVADGEALTAADLWVGSHAFYQAVIVTTDVAWAALTDAERAAVEGLQTTFGVRKVTGYAWPSATYGLSGAPVGGFELPEASLTAAGEQVFDYLVGPVPYSSWAYGYQGGVPVDPARFDTLVAAADGSTLLGVVAHPDGREELVSTVDMNPSMIHARLLIPGMVEWVTKGVHLGHHRNYLALHIDDAFLADDRWDPVANETPEDGADPIRMTPADVDRAAAWSRDTGVRLDMVYNGLGASEYGADDPLTAALLANADEFGWINHTYTHLNLDAVSADTIEQEVQDNITWADSVGLPIDPTELVTGQHSGLDNAAMPAALGQTPVTWIASDNSRTPRQQQLGPALTVPRHPANIYYNVGTFAEQLDEYNWVYHDGCTPIPGVHTCLDQPATWEQYIDSEASIMLGHMTGNDPRPHYMHQSNLAEDGTLYPVVDEALARYRRLYTAPLVQPSLAEAGALLRDHIAWRQAVTAGQVSAYYADGRIHIDSAAALAVPVTGTTVGDDYAGVPSGWVNVDGAAAFALHAPLPAPPAPATTAAAAAADQPTTAPTPAPTSQPEPTYEANHLTQQQIHGGNGAQPQRNDVSSQASAP